MKPDTCHSCEGPIKPGQETRECEGVRFHLICYQLALADIQGRIDAAESDTRICRNCLYYVDAYEPHESHGGRLYHKACYAEAMQEFVNEIAAHLRADPNMVEIRPGVFQELESIPPAP